jgi:hypothetical protein
MLSLRTLGNVPNASLPANGNGDSDKKSHRGWTASYRIRTTSLGARASPPSERVDDLPWSAWIATLKACGSPSFSVHVNRPTPSERVDRLPRIAWITSLEARGSPPSERMDRLPRSALIASLGARGSRPLERGSPPLERVNHLPNSAWITSLGVRGPPWERVDQLPRCAWIASLGARGSPPSERVDVPCVALMGSATWCPRGTSPDIPKGMGACGTAVRIRQCTLYCNYTRALTCDLKMPARRDISEQPRSKTRYSRRIAVRGTGR